MQVVIPNRNIQPETRRNQHHIYTNRYILRGGSRLTPYSRPHFLQNQIRRNLKKDVGDEKDRQGNIIFHPTKAQILLQSKNCSIPNIDTTHTRQHILPAEQNLEICSYRSRKAITYSTHNTGTTCQSIFRNNADSLTPGGGTTGPSSTGSLFKNPETRIEANISR